MELLIQSVVFMCEVWYEIYGELLFNYTLSCLNLLDKGNNASMLSRSNTQDGNDLKWGPILFELPIYGLS